MNKEKQLLLLTKEIFGKYNLLWWLELGSLLGAKREGKIIEGDDDIDLAGWEEDFNSLELRKKLTAEFLEHNVDLHFGGGGLAIEKKGVLFINLHYYKPDKEGNVYSILPTKHGIIGVNLLKSLFLSVANYYGPFMLKLKERDVKRIIIGSTKFIPTPLRNLFVRFCVWNIIRTDKCNMHIYYYPAKYYEEFVDLDFCGVSCKVPKETEKYLDMRYGNWRVPDKSFGNDSRTKIDKYFVDLNRKELKEVLLSKFIIKELKQ